MRVASCETTVHPLGLTAVTSRAPHSCRFLILTRVVLDSSILSLQGKSEHFLVLFSFHLLILALDHSQQDFIYKVEPLKDCTCQQPPHSDRAIIEEPHGFRLDFFPPM